MGAKPRKPSVEVETTVKLTIKGVEHVLTLDEARALVKSVSEAIDTPIDTSSLRGTFAEQWEEARKRSNRPRRNDNFPNIHRPYYGPGNPYPLDPNKVTCTLTLPDA